MGVFEDLNASACADALGELARAQPPEVVTLPCVRVVALPGHRLVRPCAEAAALQDRRKALWAELDAANEAFAQHYAWNRE